MSLSESALKRRHKYLGGSEISAVIGVNPWDSASDVYYEKTAEFETPKKQTRAMYVGSLCEPAILQYAEDVLGKIKRNQFRVHPDIPWASATLDAICMDLPNQGVEAKTARPGDLGGFGEEGTADIPIYYMTQVQWQMFVTGFDVIHVPVLIKDFVMDFKMYRVERDQVLIDTIVDRCVDFWENNVMKGVPPKDTSPAPATLHRMKRVPDKVTTVQDHLVQEYKDWDQKEKFAKKMKAEAKARMLEDLGDAEVGKYTGGVLDYRKRKRKAKTVNIKESEYRTLKIKEGDGDDI